MDVSISINFLMFIEMFDGNDYVVIEYFYKLVFVYVKVCLNLFLIKVENYIVDEVFIYSWCYIKNDN